MFIETIEKSFELMKLDIQANLASYSEPIDSYYEDHIIESKHFEIMVNHEKYGYYSVFENKMLTQFMINEKYISRAQEIFQQVLDKSGVEEIYLSTSDKVLLLMALDKQKEVIVQDYVFQVNDEIESKNEFVLTKALEKDIPMVRETAGEFFVNLENNVKSEELFIGMDGNEVVSYGIIEKSKIFNDLASMGMYVIDKKRGNGYGALTLINLIRQCQNAAIRPIAGCFVKNQYSANALKNAGMISMNRLLKIKV
jgi:hypothetical protein